jgi:serine/threonine protein kinase
MKEIRAMIRRVKRFESNRFQRPVDCREDNGRLYLASEFMQGENLRDMIRRGGPHPIQQAVYCVARIIESLALAQEYDLLHLELRPGKILVNRNGEVHILDLALSNVMSSLKRAQGNSNSPAQSVPLSHLHYAAPEILLHEAVPSFRSDIYSVGCILCYLLTGRPPLDIEDPLRAVIAARESPPPSLRMMNPDVPESLDHCMRKMLAKRPSDRFDSYKHLHKTLQVVYRSLPQAKVPASQLWNHVEEKSSSASLQRGSMRRYNLRRILTGGGIAASILVAFGVGLLVWNTREENSAAPPPAVSEQVKPAGPKLIRSQDSKEIPVVEAHDVFSLQ